MIMTLLLVHVKATGCVCCREIENCPNEEKQEMVEIYRDRYGFTDEDADCLVNITFKYREFFVQHMMVEELGLMANEGPSPIRRGIAQNLGHSTGAHCARVP